MRITVNDIEVIIPSSLSEMTLGQRIDFQIEHGNELDEMVKSIMAIKDEQEKELETIEFFFEKMFRTFAFFAGTTVEAVKESSFIDEISSIYHSSMAVLFEEEQSLEVQRFHYFKNEQWELQPPQLKNGDRMSFGEFIDSKQLVKDMVELGKGKWEYLLPLCAVYLRKKDELYDESFLYEGSERLTLMRDLPMDIAMQVGFFLSSTQNIYMNTLKSSGNQKPNPEENISKITSTAMAGSIS